MPWVSKSFFALTVDPARAVETLDRPVAVRIRGDFFTSEAATQVSCLLRMEAEAGGATAVDDPLHRTGRRSRATSWWRLTFAFRPFFDGVWRRIAALRELDVIDTSLPIGHARTSPLIGTYVARAMFTTLRDEAASERKSHRRDTQRRYGGCAATRSLRAGSSSRWVPMLNAKPAACHPAPHGRR